MGAIDRWLDEKYQEGVNHEARKLVLSLLTDKFGPVPAEVTERVRQADAEWCEDLNLRVARARSLEELDLS